MYFCFDLLAQNAEADQFESVAVTCPKKELTNEPKIKKCCPEGQVLDTRLEKCVGKDIELNITEKWQIQINGHLYDGYKGQNSLEEKGILSHHDNKDLVSYYDIICKKY